MLPIISLAFVGFALSVLLILSALDTPSKVSPQGCRMSYMSPSYVLQTDFNASWTSLASRYSLWLYREVGWDPETELHGTPVLFIPGNAGSSRQVRSIASSATRQYYTSPLFPSPHFYERGMKPLDFYTVDFNEDFSALHGPTLESQRKYVASALEFISSLYPEGTQIIIMGHSMGGTVAVSLLPSPFVSAIITMSTPHVVPPARFDSRMDQIYSIIDENLENDPTPIISLCGGITDTMIPSEFCTIPQYRERVFRKTVFTSGLESCWSGVGHQEMVWCHQVRWRVARAALELAGEKNPEGRARALDHWLHSNSRAVVESDTEETLNLTRTPFEVVKNGHLVLRSPKPHSVYVLPLQQVRDDRETLTVVMYTSEGVNLMETATKPPLVTLHICEGHSLTEPPVSCNRISMDTLKLLPNPDLSRPFPVPHEGVSDSEGVVAYAASVSSYGRDANAWLAVKIEHGADYHWIAVGLETDQNLDVSISSISPFYKEMNVAQDLDARLTRISIPRLLKSVLVVYQLTAYLEDSCHSSLFPPLLEHVTSSSETHYYQLRNATRLYLHGHAAAPYLPSASVRHGAPSFNRGVELILYSSGECRVRNLTLTVDWWRTFGRWGARYWSALLAWSSALVALFSGAAWSDWDFTGSTPSVTDTMGSFLPTIPKAMAVSFVLSFIPLPSYAWLGNSGEPFLSPMAPFLILVSSGLVCLSLLVLFCALRVYGGLMSIFPIMTSDTSGNNRRGLFSIFLMSLLVFLVIPWQVAFLSCYLIVFHICATEKEPIGDRDYYEQKRHILLLMTWCLPVVAPVLAVWIRTVATAGFTTPFDGDHNVLNVIGFMILTYALSQSRGRPVFVKLTRYEYVQVPLFYTIGAVVLFLFGPRSTYRIYECLNWPTTLLVCFRILPAYLHL